jgi:hypothetical protein
LQFEGGANCWTYEQVYKLTLIKFPGQFIIVGQKALSLAIKPSGHLTVSSHFDRLYKQIIKKENILK